MAKVRIRSAADPPHGPVGLVEDGKLSLTVRSMLKLSGKAQRDPKLKARWQQVLIKRSVDVPRLGRHDLEGRWLERAESLLLPERELIARAIEIGTAALEWSATF